MAHNRQTNNIQTRSMHHTQDEQRAQTGSRQSSTSEDIMVVVIFSVQADLPLKKYFNETFNGTMINCLTGFLWSKTYNLSNSTEWNVYKLANWCLLVIELGLCCASDVKALFCFITFPRFFTFPKWITRWSQPIKNMLQKVLRTVFLR